MNTSLKTLLSITAFIACFLIGNGVAEARVCSLYQGKSHPTEFQKNKQRYLQAIQKTPNQVSPYCQLSHLHYKMAGRLNEAQQEQLYDQCIHYAEAALNRDPRAGAAYFIKALCLGKRGELNGIWGSIGMLKDFEKNMKRAAELDPAIDKGGPNRALGRFYSKLPRLLGGSLRESIQNLEVAITFGPSHWENLLFLGEAYYEDEQYQRAQNLLTQFIQVTSARAVDPKMNRTRSHVLDLLKEIRDETGSP